MMYAILRWTQRAEDSTLTILWPDGSAEPGVNPWDQPASVLSSLHTDGWHMIYQTQSESALGVSVTWTLSRTREIPT